jgi:organic hydroperoxide reductase OsmC/OhrA
MSTLKDYTFGVEAARLPWRRVRLTGETKPPLEAAVPADFRGGTPGMWSPEDLLVAAVASCYELTLESVAKTRSVELRNVEVKAAGHVTRRAEGRLGFVAIELFVRITVDPGDEEAAEQAAESAHRACLVAHALDVPVELELEVRAVGQPRRVVCADAVTAMLASRG